MLVIGSSFARDFINMGQETGALSEMSISYDSFEYCEGTPWPKAILDRARSAGSVVLGSGLSARTAPCVLDAVRMLEGFGIEHVVVVGTKNFGFNNNAVMLLPADQRYAYRVRPVAGLTTANAAARAVIPAANYVDLFALMDDGTGTVPVFTP